MENKQTFTEQFKKKKQEIIKKNPPANQKIAEVKPAEKVKQTTQELQKNHYRHHFNKRSFVDIKIKLDKNWRINLLRASITLQNTILKADTRAGSKAFSYNYCTLGSILDARAFLSHYKLAFTQYIETDESKNKNIIITKLFSFLNDYNFEEVAKNEICVPDYELSETEKKNKVYSKDKVLISEETKTTYENANQVLGASISYLRRYSLYCILNIMPEEDKDGKI